MTALRPRSRTVPRPAWAGRNYVLLTTAAVVSQLGASGALVASAFAVLAAGGSATDVGLVAASRTVPLVVFLLIGGALADRLPRHRVMVAANALSCVTQALFAVLVLTGTARVWQMALLAALGGTGQAFFSPAAEGMILASVQGSASGRAFAVFRMGVNGAGILGSGLGGALVAAVGPGWVLACDAAAFAVAGALRAFLDVGAVPQRTGGTRILRDLRDGWREVVDRPWLWSIVLQFSVVNAVVAAAETVYGPLVARERLGGAQPWGTALAAFGAGTVLGGLLMTRWAPRRLLRTGVLAVLPLAAPSAALAIPVTAPVLVAVMFVTGVSVEVFAVCWMSALHQEIPEEKFSRVSSYDWLGSVALVPLATAVAGPVRDAVGRPAALWACSALVLVLTLGVLCVPDVRRLVRRTEPAAARHPVTARPPATGDDAGGAGEAGEAAAQRPGAAPLDSP